MDLFSILQAADKRQHTAVILALKQDAPGLGQLIVQGTVGDVAVGSKVPNTRLVYLAQAGDENLDIVVVLVGVYLVEDDFSGAHAVSASGVVGAALHDALVLPALDQLLGVVEVFFQLGFVLWRLQHLHQVPAWLSGLILVVGANIHVVVAHRIVG